MFYWCRFHIFRLYVDKKDWDTLIVYIVIPDYWNSFKDFSIFATFEMFYEASFKYETLSL